MKIWIFSILFFFLTLPAYSQFVEISDPAISVSSEIKYFDIQYSATYKGMHYSLKSLKNGEPAIEFILWAEKNKTILVTTPEIIIEFSPTKSITLIPYRDSSFYFNDGSLGFISIQLVHKTDIAELKSELISDLIFFGNQKEKINLTKRSKRDINKSILSFFRNYP